MLGVRKKILFSHLVILAVIALILFPAVEFFVNQVMKASLFNFGERLVKELQAAPNTESMLELMKTKKDFILRPVSLLDSQGNVVFHSYLPEMSEDQISEIQKSEPEVIEALKRGKGFDIHVSPFFNEPCYFIAIAFEAHGEKYIFHLAYSSLRIDQVKYYFEFLILILCILLIFVLTVLDMRIVRNTLYPVEVIVKAIESNPLPEISLEEVEHEQEFAVLAATLNNLSKRIKILIDDLIRQKDETVEILEALGEGIVAVDGNGKVTYINKAASKMLQVGEKKLPQNEFGELCKGILENTLKTNEPTLLSQKVESAYLDLIGIPLAFQKGALLVLQDKTADHQIIELGREFIANASHELRTPVTIIRGFAETLHDLPEIPKEMLGEITGKIVRTCIRLEKLIKSLLTLSNADQITNEQFAAVDLVSVIESAKNLLLLAHPEVEIQFKSEVEKGLIFANSNLIELTILNLLENGVKYSNPPARIEMVLKRAGNDLHLSIQDWGVGISKEDLPHIFVRFYRADKARTQFGGGAGLGLSIVKTIIEKHKGKIEVVSELGKGSTFTIILPMLTT